jgi:Cd2+/Zn2+-exporting ATPase
MIVPLPNYMTQTSSIKTEKLLITGIDCTSCKMKIEGGLEKLSGVIEASVTVSTRLLIVSYDSALITQADIVAQLKSLGFGIATQTPSVDDIHAHDDHSRHHHHEHSHGEIDFRRELILIAAVIILLTLGMIFEKPLSNTPYHIAQLLLFIPAYLVSGQSVLTNAGRNILRGEIFDENFLMTVATLGAFAIGQFPEAVAVMLFFRVGELFQEYSVGRSRRSIKELLEIRPDSANLIVNGQIKSVSPKEVQIGELVLVKPGEKVPLDGQIIEGSSQVDTSALTGESMPRQLEVGETILAGTINLTGSLVIIVTRLFEQSSIAKVLDLVEHAASKKAQTEKFISRFARYYTPVVVILSLLIAIVPPLLNSGVNRADWIYRALVLLVISCPCGLVISIPLGYFGGVGGAARKGILVKGSVFLDTLTAVKIVVFDKTGTLTQGVFKVKEVVTRNGFSESTVLKLAAQAQAQSNHPIAQSLRDAYEGRLSDVKISDYQEIAGHGIQVKIDSQVVLAGNDRLLHRENILHDTCNVSGTVVHLAVDGIYAGFILIADKVKSDSSLAIKYLKKLGIEKIIMLTGDSHTVAKDIAEELGLDNYYAQLLPEDKLSVLEQIISQSPTEKVIFVGDGINDAPVIARADVGIAMGGFGSDAAIETADIVLMEDNPIKVVQAIQVARKTRRIVIENITFALVIKGIFILLGVVGLANLWEAVFADVGVALLSILNASRVLKSSSRLDY